MKLEHIEIRWSQMWGGGLGNYPLHTRIHEKSKKGE